MATTTNSIAVNRRRVFALDLVRAWAIIVVVFIHGLATDLGIWQTALRLLLFCSVGPFIMLSGALLLPVEGSYAAFLWKRIKRVLIPFIIWSAIYAFLSYFLLDRDPALLLHKLKWCLVIPTFSEGWFIPAIFGVYLFMPVLSPWIVSASKRRLEYFLALWALSGVFPLLKPIMGLTGEYSMLNTFISLVGYAVAGYYLVHYPVTANLRNAGVWQKSQSERFSSALLMTCAVIGLAVPMIVLFGHTKIPVKVLLTNEYSITMMAWSTLFFALLVCVKEPGSRIIKAVVKSVSDNTYGIFLIHGAVKTYGIALLWPELMGSTWRTPVIFFTAYLISAILRRIPQIGRYLT